MRKKVAREDDNCWYIKGTLAWDGFLSLSLPDSLDRMNKFFFSICIIIYQDMRGFNSLSAVGEGDKRRILLQHWMIFFLRARLTKLVLEASFLYNKWCTILILSNYFDKSCLSNLRKSYFHSVPSCFSKRIRRRRQMKLGAVGDGVE